MLATIKTILKLLTEERQIKLALSNLASDPNGMDIPARMALYNRLFKVKAKLDKYSEKEIRIALGMENLTDEIREAAPHHSADDAEQPQPLPEDDFLRILLFLVLLSQDKPFQAFLALSFGAIALLLPVDPPTTPQKPALRMKF